MKPYLVSLAAGVLVGMVYSLLNVRSPAPPTIALIGLLGILLGEQLTPIGRRVLNREPVIEYVQTGGAQEVPGPEAAVPSCNDTI